MMNKKRSHQPTPIFLIALLAGYCANLLFFGKALGISVLIFVLIFLGILMFVSRKSGVTVARKNLWLVIPLVFFATMVAIRDNAFLTALNVLAVAALICYLLLYYAAGRVGDTGLMPAIVLPAYTAGKSMLAAVPIIRKAAGTSRLIWRNQTILISMARGGLLAVPILIVFTILLASADLVFANQILDLFRLSRLSTISSLFIQGLFIFGSAWAVTGGLVVALDGKENGAHLQHQFVGLRRFRFLGFTESTTILVLVNLQFLSFVFVQFRYLFGGEFNVDLSGYTYAEYARRGFFELLAVSILSLGLILGLETITWRESKTQFRSYNLLSSFLIILVVFMLISAFQRMRLYEAAFGYTQLRLYVYVFIVWLGMFLFWFLLGMWRRPERFALGAIVVAMGFLVTLNVISPDAFIVRQNIARYRAGGALDTAYLENLSADAVPAMVEAISISDRDRGESVPDPCLVGTVESSQRPCETEAAEDLQRGLSERLSEMKGDPKLWRWQSFNLARWRAYLQLSGMLD